MTVSSVGTTLWGLPCSAVQAPSNTTKGGPPTLLCGRRQINHVRQLPCFVLFLDLSMARADKKHMLLSKAEDEHLPPCFLLLAP